MDTNKKINVIEDLSRYEDYLTVGRLKKFLENNPDLPDDALVLTQRVEDKYYEENGWGVVLKEGFWYHAFNENNIRMADEILRRENGEEPEYDIEDPSKAITELNDENKEQYHPAFSCLRYNDDNNLYIDLHY
jgi:hypothetical protein